MLYAAVPIIKSHRTILLVLRLKAKCPLFIKQQVVLCALFIKGKEKR